LTVLISSDISFHLLRLLVDKIRLPNEYLRSGYGIK
jgi:hypothetical protein